jgi:hypothetical protein
MKITLIAVSFAGFSDLVAALDQVGPLPKVPIIAIRINNIT